MEEGAFLDETIDSSFSCRHLDEKEKGMVYQITSGVVRWKGYFDWVLASYAKKAIPKEIRYLLWIGLYQTAFMKKAGYHVVNETVEYVKRNKGAAPANFVNAILRRFLREREKGLAAPEDAVERSYPPWLVKKWQLRFGDDTTKKLLLVLNEVPQFSLRVDLNRISLHDTVQRLAEEGIDAMEGLLSPSALGIKKLGPLLKSDTFSRGLVSIQDEMSQLVGLTTKGLECNRILDACAGLGTKTHQLRELHPGKPVVSMDNEMKRLQFTANPGMTVLGDATGSPFKKNVFDTILLDAPCSSLGILRKHPEIKWRRRHQDILSFGSYQLTLFRSLWEHLEPGGRMIYSVCSFEPEETTGVVEKFRKERQFILENPLPFLFNKEYFLSLPHETGADGFFIAKMKKI